MHKELVILYEQDDIFTKQLLDQFATVRNFKIIEVEQSPEKKLGHLRNLAIEASSGEYICQWDDDDWYHVDRLSHQYAAIQTNANFKASILSKWLMYDVTSGHAYVSFPRLWEGSILCQKKMIERAAYINKSRGEDTVVINALQSQRILKAIAGSFHLYVYCYHGSNTWEHNHFNSFFSASEKMQPLISKKIGEIIDHKYSVEDASALLNEITINIKS